MTIGDLRNDASQKTMTSASAGSSRPAAWGMWQKLQSARVARDAAKGLSAYPPRVGKQVWRFLALAPAWPLAGCSAFDHGILAAAGPVADHERHLFMIVCIVMLFVIGPVVLLTPLFAWHYRLANTKSAYRPEWGFNWPLEGLIWIPPTGIVIGLAFILWPDTHLLDPYRPLPSALPPTEVQAVALDWKWLFIYPDLGIATVDELDIPADRPVHLSLTSGTVMQSLLLPRLAGQIYAMAGMETELNIATNEPGTYRGENVQFNGDGFQRQSFPLIARSSADFDRWLADAHRQSTTLDISGYDKLAARSVLPYPEIFGSVAPGLFKSILDQTMPGVRSADMKDHS